MNKFYITFNEKREVREYYTYVVKNNTPIALALNKRETEAFLNRIINSEIINLKENNDDIIEMYLASGEIVIIDNIKIFKNRNDEFDLLIWKIQKKIKEYLEKLELRKYKKTVTEQHKVARVNRTKNKKLNTRMLIIGASLTAFIIVGASAISSEIKFSRTGKDSYEKSELSYTISKEADNNFLNQVITYEVPKETNSSATFALAYENRVSSGKLQETIEKCGNIIEYYTKRYGLPYETTCAQLTQERGGFDNICQISYDLFAGSNPMTFHVPVYNDNGFTGTYDDFTVTKEMLDTLEGNIMVGVAYLRLCVDKYDSYITGLFSYNQGPYALSIACDYYNLDVKDFYGDDKAMEAHDLINKYYQDLNKKHGDSLYLEHVFSYLPEDERGTNTIEYYLGDKLKTIDLTNTNVYNNDLTRGN